VDDLTGENRKAALAAAIILFGFGAAWVFMPRLMLAVGSVSTVAAGILAVAFVGAFFLIFWLRSRSQNRKRH
jgi:hypothetical protein